MEYKEIGKQASEFGNRFWQVGPLFELNRCYREKEENRKKNKTKQNKKKKEEKAVNKRQRNEERESERERDRIDRGEKADDRCCQRKKASTNERKSRGRERERGQRRKKDASGIKNRLTVHGSSSASCHNRETFAEQGNSNLLTNHPSTKCNEIEGRNSNRAI